jgi:hypothetical protein
MEQLKENLTIFSGHDMAPGCLSKEESRIIASAREAYDSIVTIPCTECNYCMPCPEGVNIPGCFAAYNTYHTVGLVAGIATYMNSTGALNPETSASPRKCTKCGVCEKACPQHIEIVKNLKKVLGRLEPFWLRAAVKLYMMMR